MHTHTYTLTHNYLHTHTHTQFNPNLTYNDRKQTSGCLGIEVGIREGLQRSMRKLLGMMNIFIILITMVKSQIYAYVTINKIVHFKYVQSLSFIIYTSVNKNKTGS